MKKKLLLITLVLLPMITLAYDAHLGNIYYNFNTTAKTAEVTHNDSNDGYSGNITIPEVVTYNGIKYSVTSIGNYAFAECPDLTSVTIPSSVTSIGDDAFYDCGGLKTVTIGNGVKSIGGGAFYYCSKLTIITIPNSVINIGNGAFFNCSGLTSVTIGNSVRSIDKDAFAGCSKLTSVYINDLDNWCKIKFTDPYSNPLYGCRKLFLNGSEVKSLTIPNSVTIIRDYAFYRCSIESVTIPDGVTSIGSCAFYQCDIDCVTIPNTVTSIGDHAFWASPLKSIIIGKSINSIGNNAFGYCQNLTDVTCKATNVPNTTSDAFQNSTIGNATLFVPESAIDAYKAKSPWNSFNEIVAIQSNQFFCEDVECVIGSEPTLYVELKNEDEVKLCQFDLRLPAGVTIATMSNGKLDVKLTKRANNHSISRKLLNNGDYRFVISSLDNDSFTGSDGILMEIKLDVSATMEAGEYAVKLLNAELSVPDGNDLKVVKTADTESKLTIKAYTPGDVNNDGSVSVTDVGCTINYILEQVPSVFVFEAADMNGDKNISVTDVGMIINLILNEGSAASPQMNRAAAEYSHLAMQSTTDGYQLRLENKDAFIGFQMDVQVANNATINGMKLIGGDNHLMTYRQLDNGTWRVVCYSPTNSTFEGNEAGLLDISTTGDVTISNVRLTTTDLNEVSLDAVSGGTTGITDRLVTQNEELKVYTLDGRLCRVISKQYSENPLSGLKPGVYMIGNRKVVVR